MSFTRFKQILNDELIACFKNHVCREDSVTQFNDQVKNADDFAAINKQINRIYHVVDLFTVWDEVKAAAELNDAIKIVAKRHKALVDEIPTPTVDYQYSTAVAITLLRVMKLSIQENLLGKTVSAEVQSYIEKYEKSFAESNFSYSFGTLTPKKPLTLFASPPTIQPTSELLDETYTYSP